MGDIFREQLVEVKQTSTTTMKKTGVIIVAIIIALVAITFGGAFIGPLVVVGVIIGASYLIKSMNLEYEYILTNNELDIDKIMNKERRKRLLTVDIKEINVMAHIDDGMRKGELERAQKTIDVSSGEKGSNTYVIVFNHNETLTKLIFEPNEDVKRDIYRQAPSKVFL